MSDLNEMIRRYLDEQFGPVATPAKVQPPTPKPLPEDDEPYIDSDHQEAVKRRLKNPGCTP